MNLKKISLLTAASVLALASCKKAQSDVEQPGSNNQTSGMLRIQVSSPNDTRAAESEGREEERTVNKVNLYIFSPNGNLVDKAEFTKDANAAVTPGQPPTVNGWTSDTNDKFMQNSNGVLVVPFQTKAEAGVDNKLVVILNQPSTFTAPTNYTAFTTAAAQAMALTYTDHVKNMATDNNFMMVGCVPKFVLQADKTYDDVKGYFNASDHSKNQYLINADRSVSKLVVDIKNGVDLVGTEFGSGDAAATIQGYSIDGANGDKLYFTVANSNKAMYVYNNPRTTQIGPDADNGVVAVADADYKTPNMNFKSSKTDIFEAEKAYRENFYRVSEDANNVVSGTGFYAPIEVKTLGKAKAEDADYYAGKYFMEADHSTEWLWANTPVAKIYACVLPKAIYVLKAGDVLEKVTITDLQSLKDAVKADVTADNIVEADGSFLMGADGKFYASQAAANKNNGLAKDAAVGTAVKTKLYQKGRCVYRFPVNADSYEYTAFNNAYNKRNHIYNLTIEAIKGIGDNYDPTDPKDPNVPMPTDPDNPKKPLNPNEPTVKPDEPIKKSKTYAAVKCLVKAWQVVSNNVTLGN